MTGGPARGLIAFRVGATRAALPLACVREVVQNPGVVPVPGSHPHVAGVALNRGVALPVYDLLEFAPFWSSPAIGERPGGRPAPPHLIVCGFGEVLLGVLGDQVDLLEDHAPLDDPASDPGRVRREYLSGLLRSGGEVVALLDPERLFPSLGVPAERT